MAVVIYECLSGELPFSGETTTDVLIRICTERPQPLSARNTGLDPALTMVVDRALATDPADRFPDMAAFIEALLEAEPEGVDVALERELLETDLAQHLVAAELGSAEADEYASGIKDSPPDVGTAFQPTSILESRPAPAIPTPSAPPAGPYVGPASEVHSVPPASRASLDSQALAAAPPGGVPTRSHAGRAALLIALIVLAAAGVLAVIAWPASPDAESATTTAATTARAPAAENRPTAPPEPPGAAAVDDVSPAVADQPSPGVDGPVAAPTGTAETEVPSGPVGTAQQDDAREEPTESGTRRRSSRRPRSSHEGAGQQPGRGTVGIRTEW
jgi:serine/threonine-protein kinase